MNGPSSDAPRQGRRVGASLEAAELIRKAIVGGRLAPGERLKEEELAREFGISRTPVREALLVLRTEGLVHGTPSGAIVPSYEQRDIENLYGLRALLEGYAARRAATLITRRALRALAASCERFASLTTEADDLPKLVEENMLFHRTIHESAGDPRLAAMVKTVTDLPLVYRSYLWFSAAQKASSVHQHVQLTAVLTLRDGERAELIMREHLLEARDALIARMRGAGDEHRAAG